MEIDNRINELLEVVNKKPELFFYEPTINLQASKMNLVTYIRIHIDWNERIYNLKTAVQHLKDQVIEKKLHQTEYNLLKTYSKIFYANQK